MDRFSLLILLTLAALFSGRAHAQAVPQATAYVCVNSVSQDPYSLPPSRRASAALAAAQSYAAQAAPGAPTRNFIVETYPLTPSGSTGQVSFETQSTLTGSWTARSCYVKPLLYCPENSTLSGSSCLCASGYSPSSGECVPSSSLCPAAGEVVAPMGTMFQAGNGLTTVVCLAGCEASAFMAARNGGTNYVWGPIVSVGRSCSGSSTSAASEASPQCPVGKCPGTINGQTICVACAETKETGTVSSSESAASSASGATPGPSQTSSSTGSTATTCSGGQCTTTTTTTTTKSDGSTEDKTTSTTRPQSDYCKENPTSATCKASESAWGGTCGAFTCDGDAVQCAQAKAGWDLACSLKVDEANPLIGVGQQATQGGDRPPDHPANNANTVALDLSTRLSSVPLFGATGDCIADKSVSFMGKSYNLPFSKWCPYLNILGSAFLAACYLAAAFIIFRD